MRAPRRMLAVALALLVAGITGGADAAPTISHGEVTSFDGTAIAYTLFVPDDASSEDPVPIVFMTHGWGMRRERANAGMVANLTGAGYAVITWDQRGFGDSGGEAQVDSQDFEVRDVQALIDLVADPATTGGAVLLDADGDPRMGMIGGSYAGGIQLMTAAADTRVDAIVPQITWNDLPEALRPGGVLKLGWDVLLYGSGFATGTAEGLDAPGGPRTGAYAQEIHQSFVEGLALNDWSDETFAWYDSRSTKHYVGGTDVLPGVQAATLLVQGVNDTLFPINHAIDTYNAITANGSEARMIFFCGLLVGSTHAVHSLRADASCDDGDQGPFITAAALQWFDRHLNGNPGATAISPISFQTQDGTFATATALPSETVAGAGTGTLVNTVAPTSSSQALATPSAGGFRVPITGASGRTLLGVPEVDLAVTGTGLESYVFMRLLDVAPDGTEIVIDDQVGAQKVVNLSDVAQQSTVELPGVAWEVASGHELVLELTSTSADHSSSRVPSVSDITLSVSVPVL